MPPCGRGSASVSCTPWTASVRASITPRSSRYSTGTRTRRGPVVAPGPAAHRVGARHAPVPRRSSSTSSGDSPTCTRRDRVGQRGDVVANRREQLGRDRDTGRAAPRTTRTPPAASRRAAGPRRRDRCPAIGFAKAEQLVEHQPVQPPLAQDRPTDARALRCPPPPPSRSPATRRPRPAGACIAGASSSSRSVRSYISCLTQDRKRAAGGTRPRSHDSSRWVWALTRPGSSTAEPRSMTRSAGGASCPCPIAAMRSPPSTDPTVGQRRGHHRADPRRR